MESYFWCIVHRDDVALNHPMNRQRVLYTGIKVWVLIEQKDGKSTQILGENSGSKT